MAREAPVERNHGESRGAGESGQVSVRPDVWAGARMSGCIAPGLLQAGRLVDEPEAGVLAQGVIRLPGLNGVEHVGAHDALVGEETKESLLRYPAHRDLILLRFLQPLHCY